VNDEDIRFLNKEATPSGRRQYLDRPRDRRRQRRGDGENVRDQTPASEGFVGPRFPGGCVPILFGSA